jgi:hypothetical protein
MQRETVGPTFVTKQRGMLGCWTRGALTVAVCVECAYMCFAECIAWYMSGMHVSILRCTLNHSSVYKYMHSSGWAYMRMDVCGRHALHVLTNTQQEESWSVRHAYMHLPKQRMMRVTKDENTLVECTNGLRWGDC